jgi:hypothetical protein
MKNYLNLLRLYVKISLCPYMFQFYPLFSVICKVKSQNWGPIMIIQGEIKFESLCLTFFLRTHLKNFFETFFESTFEGCFSIETFDFFFNYLHYKAILSFFCGWNRMTYTFFSTLNHISELFYLLIFICRKVPFCLSFLDFWLCFFFLNFFISSNLTCGSSFVFHLSF